MVKSEWLDKWWCIHRTPCHRMSKLPLQIQREGFCKHSIQQKETQRNMSGINFMDRWKLMMLEVRIIINDDEGEKHNKVTSRVPVLFLEWSSVYMEMLTCWYPNVSVTKMLLQLFLLCAAARRILYKGKSWMSQKRGTWQKVFLCF